MIVVPGEADDPALGLCETTWSTGAAFATSERVTLKPAPFSALSALAYCSPTTDGTPTVFGPVETFSRTVDPTSTSVPFGGERRGHGARRRPCSR